MSGSEDEKGSLVAKPEDPDKVARAKELAQEPDESDAIFKVIRRFLFKSMAWVGIYFLGYYDFSIAWLFTPLLLTVLGDQWKKERDYKLAAAKQAALTDEKTMIKSRIRAEDLPSWVFFPDKERAEWINSIIQQLWFNIGNYTRKIIAESVEPAVAQGLETANSSLTGFKFDKVVLGQVPPRITGIKVYDKNVDRNEIIMDLDLVFASDAEIKFSLKGISAKISDFSLKGLVRVVFKPLVTDIPLIGGIQVYFLTAPDIDFDLGGVANALDMPGLSAIIRKIVQEQLGAFMVLPNKFTMQLAESVTPKQLKCPDTAGVLRVKLKNAEKLEKKDIGVLGMGKSDPYAVLSVGARTLKTHHIKNTINPVWDFVGDFPIEVPQGQSLCLEIFDHDDAGDDDFLGRGTVATNQVASQGHLDLSVNLEDTNGEGMAFLSLSWLRVSSDPKDLPSSSSPGDGVTQCLLHVYLDSCKNLEPVSSKKPSPIVEMSIGSGEECSKQISRLRSHNLQNLEPVFEQGFVFLVNSPNSDDLHLKVIDSVAAASKNARSSQKLLGSIKIQISDLMKRDKMEYKLQPFAFTDGNQGTLKMALELKALKAPKAETPKKDKVPFSTMDEEPWMDKHPPADTKKEGPVNSEPPSAAKGKVGQLVSPLDSEPETSPERATSATDSKGQEWGEPGEERINPVPKILETVPKAPNFVKSPSLDEMMANTLAPMAGTIGLDTEDVEDLISKRIDEAPLGRVQLSLEYNDENGDLIVVLHQAEGLPGGDLPDPPDPYVKMYLLPARKSKSKRKSDVKKDTVNPVFEETFKAYDEDLLKGVTNPQLEVSVIDKKGIFARSPLMGRTVVDIDITPGTMSGYIIEKKWFNLEEADDDSDE